MRTRVAVSLLACLLLLGLAPSVLAQSSGASNKSESKKNDKDKKSDKEKAEELDKKLSELDVEEVEKVEELKPKLKKAKILKTQAKTDGDNAVEGGVEGGGKRGPVGGLLLSSKLHTSNSANTDTTGEVAVGRPQVLGFLDKNDIRRVVMSNRAAVKACYERELSRNSNLAGLVRVKFTIGKTGKVVAAYVKTNELSPSKVDKCLTAEILTWQFPAPKRGGIVIVNYPFNFTSTHK